MNGIVLISSSPTPWLHPVLAIEMLMSGGGAKVKGEWYNLSNEDINKIIEDFKFKKVK